MAQPHITNSEAGRNKYDPAHKSMYEVYFTLPELLRDRFAQDEALLTEHVQTISGLDALYKGVEADQQKYHGVSVSYLKPTAGDTFAEITVKFSLNLRNGTDNYVYNLFNAWKKLGYNIATGERHLKKDYCADWIHLKVANRIGEVYHDVIMKDVMLVGPVVPSADYDYSADDALELEVKFRTDWWRVRDLDRNGVEIEG